MIGQFGHAVRRSLTLADVGRVPSSNRPFQLALRIDHSDVTVPGIFVSTAECWSLEITDKAD